MLFHIFSDSNLFFGHSSTSIKIVLFEWLDLTPFKGFLIPMKNYKEAKDVRWLSHDMAIKAVIHTYTAILISLDREASERGEPTAHDLLKFMKCYKFLACAYLLSDVLPRPSHFACIFQKQNIDLSLIQPHLWNIIDCIKQYRVTFGLI